MGRKVHSLREVERVLRRGEEMRRAEEMWRRVEKMPMSKVNSPVNILAKWDPFITLSCYRFYQLTMRKN
jgi:hypothetical protein